MRIFLFIVSGLFLFSFSDPDPTPYVFPELPFFPPMPQNPENPVTKEGVELGRHLFYDNVLSLKKDISCSTCHRQENAFSDGGKKFSRGTSEIELKRNTPPLFNLAWKKELFWDGRAVSIEDQVFFPVRDHDEMALDWTVAAQRLKENDFYREKFDWLYPGKEIDSMLISKVIAQFERTLISYNSKYDEVIRGEAYFTKAERNGLVLMNDMTKGDCLHCHPTDGSPIMANPGFSNNGLEPINSYDVPDIGRAGVTGKKSDIGKFKIPSLRNLAVTGPYMHDGRFENLEEVLEFYTENLHPSLNYDTRFSESINRGGVRLNDLERKEVLAFLMTLTDSVLINNPAHSNPWDN